MLTINLINLSNKINANSKKMNQLTPYSVKVAN